MLTIFCFILEHRPMQRIRLRPLQEPQRRSYRHPTAQRLRVRSFNSECRMVQAAGAAISVNRVGRICEQRWKIAWFWWNGSADNYSINEQQKTRSKMFVEIILVYSKSPKQRLPHLSVRIGCIFSVKYNLCHVSLRCAREKCIRTYRAKITRTFI